MSGPGGKLNTCPCGTTGGAPIQQTHRPPPSCGPPPTSCGPPPASCGPPQQMPQMQPQAPAGCQQLPVQNQYQQRPHVECSCTQNRVRNVRPPPLQADIVSCSRPPREQFVMEPPRCNCRPEPAPPPPPVKACTCAPLPAPPQIHTTHVHMPCPQAHNRGPVPYQRHTQPCAHCRSQQTGGPGGAKKKKCVIQ